MGQGAQLQDLGLSLARAGRLIRVACVNPTGKDQLWDSFLTGLNQHAFNEQQLFELFPFLHNKCSAVFLMARFGIYFHHSQGYACTLNAETNTSFFIVHYSVEYFLD